MGGEAEGSVLPDHYTLDLYYMSREGEDEIQSDLIYDYRTNVAFYPTFQKYLRTYQPPLLAIWGKNDVSSSRQVPKHSRKTSRMPSSASSTQATSHWRPTPEK